MAIKRICAGVYEIRVGDRAVSITRLDHLEYEYGQWVVSAEWDGSLYSDPIVYLRDAKACAFRMIEES